MQTTLNDVLVLLLLANIIFAAVQQIAGMIYVVLSQVKSGKTWSQSLTAFLQYFARLKPVPDGTATGPGLFNDSSPSGIHLPPMPDIMPPMNLTAEEPAANGQIPPVNVMKSELEKIIMAKFAEQFGNAIKQKEKKTNGYEFKNGNGDATFPDILNDSAQPGPGPNTAKRDAGEEEQNVT